MKILFFSLSLLLAAIHLDSHAKKMQEFYKPEKIAGTYTCPANALCAINVKVKRGHPIQTDLKCTQTTLGRQVLHLFETRTKGKISYKKSVNGITETLPITITNTSSAETVKDRKTIGAIVHFCCDSQAYCGKFYRD